MHCSPVGLSLEKGESAIPAHDFERATLVRTPNYCLRLFAWLSGMPCICAKSSRVVHPCACLLWHDAELQHRVRRASIAPGDHYAHSLHRAGWNLRHEADSAIKSKGRQSLQNSDTRETGRDWPVMPTIQTQRGTSGRQMRNTSVHLSILLALGRVRGGVYRRSRVSISRQR